MSGMQFDNSEYQLRVQRYEALSPRTQGNLDELAKQAGFTGGVRNMWRLFRDNGAFSILADTLYGFKKKFIELVDSLRAGGKPTLASEDNTIEIPNQAIIEAVARDIARAEALKVHEDNKGMSQGG